MMTPNGKTWIRYEERYQLRVLFVGAVIIFGVMFSCIGLLMLVFPPLACT